MLRKYPGLLVLLFVVSGIIIADLSRLPSYLFLLTALIAFLLGLYLVLRHVSGGTVVVFCFTLGAVAASHFSLKYVDIGPNHLKQVIIPGEAYSIYGRVADWPDLKIDNTEIKIAVDSLVSDRVMRVQGGILLKVSDTTTALQRGDRVAFRGRIYLLEGRRVTGRFDYGRYLNLKSVHGIVYRPTLLGVEVDKRSKLGLLNIVDDLRSAIRESFHRNLTPEASALAVGFLIGETRDIPTGVYRMFRDSGTVHLLAVSGSNVALVILFCAFLLRPFRLSTFTRSLLLLSVIVVFTLLSYADPSVVRASIMASLIIFARLLRRKYDLNNIIAVTALIVLLIAPAQLYDVGFQLSFVTAWGLILLLPGLTTLFKEFHGRWWYRAIVFPLMVSIVAQICSTPVIAYYFGRVPVISVAANLVIVPLVSLAVVGILGLLVVDVIWPLLGQFVGSLVNGLLQSVVWLLTLMGGENIPILAAGHYFQGGRGLVTCLVIYILICLAVWSLREKRARRWLIFVFVLVINGILVSILVTDADRRCHLIDFHTVPGGVATIVHEPDSDEFDLILTGLSRKRYQIDEKVLIPMIEDLGLGKLSNLFLLSADYHALDDVLRLARIYDAARLHVHRDLRQSLQDVISLQDIAEVPELDITYYGDSTVGAAPGYYASSDGLTLKTSGTNVVFMNRLSDSAFPAVVSGTESILVIGERWSPAAEDWIKLHDLGWNIIACSDLEHPEPIDYGESELESDRYPPDYVVVLSKMGCWRLAINASAEK